MVIATLRGRKHSGLFEHSNISFSQLVLALMMILEMKQKASGIEKNHSSVVCSAGVKFLHILHSNIYMQIVDCTF